MAHWQVVAFQLPLAQHKTARWWVPPPAIPGLWLEQYTPSPASSNFRVMREQRTLALARVLQAHTKESGCPAGVLCDTARELQQGMAPLLALNDEIVEASLLQPMEGEHRTSPMPEEEATLLANIKPISNLTSNLTSKHPMFLHCWRSRSRHSLQGEPSLLPALPHLLLPKVPPFPKGKEAQEQDNWNRCHRHHPMGLFLPRR